MTVHMIQVIAASNSTDTGGMTLSEINAAMDDWMSKQSEWTGDPEEHTTREVVYPDLPFTPYYRGGYRLTFDSEPKDNLLQKCGDKLKTKVDWYRLGYHECPHDETDWTDCPWDDEREWMSKNTGSIPNSAPDFL